MSQGTTRLSILSLAMVLAGPSAAMGFGEFRANVLLGQPLNLAMPVTLAEGETLGPECASAEVTSGESRLPPGTVRVRVTQGRDANEAVLRISTSVVIDEPVVNVTVSAGCPTRITRQLVLLADPPLVAVTPPPSAAPAVTAAAPAAQPQERALPPTTTTAPTASASEPARPPAQRRTPRPQAAPAPDGSSTAAAQPVPPRPPRTAVSAPRPRPPAAPERARLQLDGGTVAPATAAAAPAAAAAAEAAQAAQAQAAAAAASAVAVAEAAASAAQQRLKDMEAEMGRLRAESKAQTEALVELRKQLAEDRNRKAEPGWMMSALLALVGLLAVAALWLAWRLREQQRARVIERDAWYERSATASVAPSLEPGDADSQPAVAVPAVVSSTLPPPPPAPKGGVASLRMPLSPPSMFDERGGGLDSMISPPTMPAHTPVTMPIGNARPDDDALGSVSVDEQIDLEQQADFFIALGHDESAIDLLMAHLRSTGGGTPLPFLKLLEIHRRRGDRDAYERTRVRFNQRFNSVAPEWQANPHDGRALEDYPLVVGRIQTAWPTPLDAMAELEALLFRRGVGSEMFELPAYQELLFLYQLARDLHQQSGADASGEVDVLLPIMTEPVPLAEGSISVRPEFNGGKAMTLDLDLGGDRLTQGDKPMLELDLGSDTAAKPAGDATPDGDGPRKA